MTEMSGSLFQFLFDVVGSHDLKNMSHLKICCRSLWIHLFPPVYKNSSATHTHRIHQLQQMKTENHLLIIWNSLKDQSSPCVHVLGVTRSSNKQHYRPGRGPLGPWTQRLTLLKTNSRISDETNSETREQLRLIQLWTLTLTEASTWRNNLSHTEETVEGKLLTHTKKQRR